MNQKSLPASPADLYNTTAYDPLVTAWRAEGRHLPPELRDFHAQKTLFQAIDRLLGKGSNVRPLSPMDAHAYTLDSFLWFMARHGYTLQKSRAKLAFSDLKGALDSVQEERRALFGTWLAETPGSMLKVDGPAPSPLDRRWGR